MNNKGEIMKKDQKQAAFLDALIDTLDLKNDAALSRTLGVAPPVISKIRHNTLPIGASLQIKILDITGWTLNDMWRVCGDLRRVA